MAASSVIATPAPYGAGFDVGFLSVTYETKNLPIGRFRMWRRSGYSHGEDSHKLRLTSQLVDLRLANANPAPYGAGFDVGFLSVTYETKNLPIGRFRMWRRERDSNP